MERIFITGLGIISCKGCSVEDFWSNINNVDGHSPVDMKVDIPQVFNNNVTRRIDKFTRLSLTASKLAIDGSSLNDKEYDPFRVGTVLNMGYGPLNSNLSFGYKLMADGVDMVSPTLFAGSVYNASVGQVCINLKLKGASTMLLGSNSIGYSCDLLNWGRADALLAGGVEEICSELDECYKKSEYVTKDDEFICRPMDERRDGTRVVDGAAVLALEKENAPFFNPDRAMCEILGHGNALAYSNPGIAVKPFNGQAFVDAMTVALEESKIRCEQIDVVFMAANGGRFGDLAEAEAIRTVFGKRGESVTVTSIKGATGETMGASLGMNTVAAALSLKKGVIPPTVGCRTPDPEIGLNVVYTEDLKGCFRYAMVNGYDVSGGVYSVILRAI